MNFKGISDRINKITSSSNNILYEKDPNASNIHTDEQIWKMLKEGNDAALIELYNRYFQVLGTYGYQFTKNKALIEDAIQDLFVDINIKRNQLPEIKYSLKSYLFKSLKYKILQYLRNDAKNMTIGKESSFFEFDYEFSIEHNIIAKQSITEQKQRLKRATDTLTARQREALYYYFNEQMSYKQVKDIMEFTTIKSVRNLIYKAISRIRNHF